jgi:D-arabinose 1-dehydrogenase-like Zn-dependent alcohol dehydrogenase
MSVGLRNACSDGRIGRENLCNAIHQESFQWGNFGGKGGYPQNGFFSKCTYACISKNSLRVGKVPKSMAEQLEKVSPLMCTGIRL